MFACAPATEEPADTPVATDGEWEQALQALDLQLQQGNLNALESVQALTAQIPREWRGSVEAIRQAVDALDFAQARQLLHALHHSIQGD